MTDTAARPAIQDGDRIAWTDPSGLPHTGTVQKYHASGLIAEIDDGRHLLLVRWDAPGLRLLEAEPAALAVPESAGETAALTITEREELTGLERTVEQGRAVFVAVGAALTAIRDRRLYRETHPTWEAYLRDRWDMSRQYAHDMIAATQVVEDVSAIADIVPQSESVARPLARLTTEDRQAAWSRAVETAGGQPTAAQVRQAVDEVAPAPVPAVKPLPKPEEPRRVVCGGVGDCLIAAEDCLAVADGTREALQAGGWECLGVAWHCPPCVARKRLYTERMELLQPRYELACEALWAEIEAAALDGSPTPLLGSVLAAAGGGVP
ncbi:MAG: hypothetical protein Q7T33_09175 [Dehalococcoidia bacterium]|nr:hypothetical protein [Dehalococcoidia bacterium]